MVRQTRGPVAPAYCHGALRAPKPRYAQRHAERPAYGPGRALIALPDFMPRYQRPETATGPAGPDEIAGADGPRIMRAQQPPRPGRDA